MHDCGKAQRRLTDVLFRDASPEDRRRALMEMAGCQCCASWFDDCEKALHALESAQKLPDFDEAYWRKYELELSSRLARRSGRRQAAWRWAAAALVLFGLLALHQGWRSRTASPGGGNIPRKAVSAGLKDDVLITTLDIRQHLEAVRLLLIAVKNGAPGIHREDKDCAERLLMRLRLLRAEAGHRQDVFARTLLDRVEPHLLDIANCAGSSEEATRIRYRLKQTGIAALLAAYVEESHAAI